MIRFLIQLIMFGCTIFTIIHFIKKARYKKQQKYKNDTVPKLSELKGKAFSDQIEL